MSDKMVIPCSECGSNLAVPSTAAGKRVRCPKCKTEVAIPGGTATVRREPRQSAAAPEPEPRRARKIVEPTQPARRRSKEPIAPDDNAWLDDGASSNSQAGSEWDSYGTPEQLPQALPPRAKRKNAGSQAPQLRGTGNEPAAPYERPQEAVARASNGSMITGILMMVGAVIWFVGGLAADIIFFYPPVLFVLGFIALVKGVLRTE
ncbi:MAG: hypothetical protein WKF77_19710 [Planctomycetaceae bacterium]